MDDLIRQIVQTRHQVTPLHADEDKAFYTWESLEKAAGVALRPHQLIELMSDGQWLRDVNGVEHFGFWYEKLG